MSRFKPVLLVALAGLAITAGTAGAASFVTSGEIKNNTIKSKDVRNGTLTGKDVRNGSLSPADFNGPVATTGTPGPRGATGLQGPRGPQGEKGDKGDKGDPGPFPEGDLPAGKTLRGSWAMAAEGPSTDNGSLGMTAISFGFQLAAVPTPHLINSGATPPSGCTGNANTPGADPGHLCVFEQSGSNETGPNLLSLNKFGAGLYFFAGAGASYGYEYGTWAVTSA